MKPNTIEGIFTCGSNSHGQLCLGNFCDRIKPTKLDFKPKIVGIHCGPFFTILMTEHGVYVCGLYCPFGTPEIHAPDYNRLNKLHLYYEIIGIHCQYDNYYNEL